MKQNGVKIVGIQRHFGAQAERDVTTRESSSPPAKSSPKEVKELWDLAKAKNMLNQ